MIDQKTNYLFKKSAKKYNKLPYLKAELGKIRYVMMQFLTGSRV